MDDTIAVREFVRLDGRSVIRIELCRPSASIENNEWLCRFRIVDGGVVAVDDHSFGSDSLQAVVSAIAGIRWQFEHGPLNGVLNKDESWFKDESRSTGLPIYLPQGLGYEFDRRLRELVEGEIARHLRELEIDSSRALYARKSSGR